MASEKIWSNEFKKYMKDIVNHENYEGIPYKLKSNDDISWIAAKTSDIGKARIEWAKSKARQLGFKIEPGVYAKVMFAIHPTKIKPCQICGKPMGLYYMYLNNNLVKAIKKKYDVEVSEIDSIFDAIDKIKATGVSINNIKRFLIEKFSLYNTTIEDSIETIANMCELVCRNGNLKLLGPGAMSNFPDRLDGFHTYNRCCRSKEDTGRHKDNMKTYSKDRRAYEYWSDGNIHAANKFMNSEFFAGTSADHIGPISLGFKHDPLLLQRMSKGDNSSKRDRLIYEDIEKIVEIEKCNKGFSAMSWFSEEIWLYIKNNYYGNNDKMDLYRDVLKQNMANFMYILWIIKNKCSEKGSSFLIKNLLEPKFECFQYDYEFDDDGVICNISDRNFTDATRKEIDRFVRVAFEAVDDYQDKENRNIKPFFEFNEMKLLHSICLNISADNNKEAVSDLLNLIHIIQQKLIHLVEHGTTPISPYKI